jgi:hypothetical protein
MRNLLLAAWVLVAGAELALAQKTQAVPGGALLGDRIVYLDADGSWHAWSLARLKEDAALAKALALPGAVAVAYGEGRLFATDGSQVSAFSSEKRAWERIAALPAHRNALLRLLVASSGPVVVYPDEVYEVGRAIHHRVPELTPGQVHPRSLRLLDACAAGDQLWVGTGYGEWGGHLVGLALGRAAWSQHYDSLHYATGLAEKNGKLFVSWSMSHFRASTLLRIHRPDGGVEREFPELNNHYYQKLAFGLDGQLYAIERERLVKVVDGAPVLVAELGKLRYSPEPNAIGVAPGIVQLLALDARTWLVVTISDGAIAIRDGIARRL